MNPTPRVAVTVGSALIEDDMIQAVILGGVDIFRIPQVAFSFEQSIAYAKKVKELANKYNKNVEVIFDYSGEREHLGIIDKEFRVDSGEVVRFIRAPRGSGKDNLPLLVSDEDWSKLQEDQRIFVADGAIQARIRSLGSDNLTAVVEVVTEAFKTDADINFPDSDIHVNPISQRERSDMPKLADLKVVDWATLSFVENADEVRQGKKLLGSVKLMPKIESEVGVKNITEIVAAADGVMVARGDLAIQAPMERLGIYERLIIKAAKTAGKPVMLATQFLESMMTNPIPLRAELSDVATAAFLGVDSILLTKEIAKGAYPLRALAIAKGTLAYTAAHMSEVE